MAPLDPDEFEKHSEEVKQDRSRTITRIVGDYEYLWKGAYGEASQNAYDGWCNNRKMGIIPDDRHLRIEFGVHIPERRFAVIDNAGGMDEETFYNDFTGIDTPGKEKRFGGSGGSWGRGFHVIAGVGQVTEAETDHGDFHGGVEVRGDLQARRDDPDMLENLGTRIDVHDCDPDQLEYMADLDRVEEYFQARFQKMLEHDDVTVKITVITESGTEERTLESVDLSQFPVLEERDEVEYELRNGDTGVIRNLVVYGCDEENVPFQHLSMCKRNEYEDRPFMRVHRYRPDLRDIDKVFGFCDSSDLAEYEKNDHQGYRNGVHQQTPLKDILRDIVDREFGDDPIDTEKHDEIKDQAFEIFGEIVGDDPFDQLTESDIDSPLTADGGGAAAEASPEGDSPFDAGDEAVEQDDRQVGGDDQHTLDDLLNPEEEEPNGEASDPMSTEDADDEDPEPILRCTVTNGREVEEGEEVIVRPMIENPAGSGIDSFSVRGEMEHKESGETFDLNNIVIDLEEGMTSSGVQKWSFDPPEGQTGQYIFRGELYEKGHTKERLDNVYNYFHVGEPAASLGVPKGTPVEDVIFSYGKDEDDFRYIIDEGKEAWRLHINRDHPEYQRALDEDGDSRIEVQAELVAQYMVIGVYRAVAENRIRDLLEDVSTPEGENAADEVVNLYETLAEQKVAEAFAKLNRRKA